METITDGKFNKMIHSLIYEASNEQYARFKDYVYKELEKQKFDDVETCKEFIDTLIRVTEKARENNKKYLNVVVQCC